MLGVARAVIVIQKPGLGKQFFIENLVKDLFALRAPEQFATYYRPDHFAGRFAGIAPIGYAKQHIYEVYVVCAVVPFVLQGGSEAAAEVTF